MSVISSQTNTQKKSFLLHPNDTPFFNYKFLFFYAFFLFQNVNYYPTKFTPPKKESKDGRLSEGIKKFLARKEEEEKQKALEEKRKKQV